MIRAESKATRQLKCLHVSLYVLLALVIGELLLRIFHEGQYPLITLNLELLLVGSLMTFATVRFHVVCKKLFG